MKNGFLIAAPMSGSGKTTIARGLMALFTGQGLRVQPFKCGPDYIDTKFHAAVCGRPSVNLDTFMATTDHVAELFEEYTRDADVAVVEGMMGLFDGYDGERGSSAEVARVLGLPVVLVVDASSMGFSVAPLLQGFVGFRRDVSVAGVVFNKVGSERHLELLRRSCEEVGVSCLGYVPRKASLVQGSRYLGLDFTERMAKDELVRQLEETVDWRQLLTLQSAAAWKPDRKGWKAAVGGTVLVAKSEESFSFCYQELLDRFETVRFFNPEREVPSLEGVDLLYLPGGYPEKHLGALAAAEATREAVRAFAERGGRVRAECGGMMYLCRSIVDDTGSYPMCGVLPYTITARKEDRRLSLGYRRFVLDGREYRGHEFHYTQFLGDVPSSVCQVQDAQGRPVGTPVIRYKNVLASYTHLYQL